MPTKQPTSNNKSLPALTTEAGVEQRILLIRGQKVILDSDLAELYGVTTKRLNEQVKRNLRRFPEDFMFRLTIAEARELLLSRSQIATLKRGQNIKYAPYAFTEHGAVMLASVLNSGVAIQASIQVVRAFVRLRNILAAHKELAKKLGTLERKTDNRFKVVFELIAKYLKPEQKKSGRMGFHTDE
jgi:hypothetical protein